MGIAGTEKINFFDKDNASKKLTFISESSKSSHASLLKEKDIGHSTFLHLTEAIAYLIFVNFGTPPHFFSL